MYKNLTRIFVSLFGKENAIALYRNIVDNESNNLSKIQKLIKIFIYPVLMIPGAKQHLVKLKNHNEKIFTYNSDILNVSVNSIYDLPNVVIHENRPKTVNVLVPAFSIATISAGFFGVFNLAKFISRQGLNVRLVLFDNFYYNAEEFEKSLKNYPGIEDLFDILEIEYIGNKYKPLYVSREDHVVATVWYSAYFARKILETINSKSPFLYLIQDYEAAFYPANSLYCLAHETYNMNYNALVSSESLYNYMLTKSTTFKNLHHQGRAAYFNNSCSAVLQNEEDFFRSHSTKKKTFAFYSRPSVNRNMFELGALAIVTAWKENIFNDGNNWSLLGMGIGNVEIHLDKASKLVQMPRMSLAEYERSITNIDVALSLMASPHPSITPFDIAGIGGLVVTNSFENKDESYFAEITRNIIVKKPTLDDIVQGIAEAVSNVDDLSGRYYGAISMKFPKNWSQSWADKHLHIINQTFKPS